MVATMAWSGLRLVCPCVVRFPNPYFWLYKSVGEPDKSAPPFFKQAQSSVAQKSNCGFSDGLCLKWFYPPRPSISVPVSQFGGAGKPTSWRHVSYHHSTAQLSILLWVSLPVAHSGPTLLKMELKTSLWYVVSHGKSQGIGFKVLSYL